jgi:hypothetical protein
MFNVLPDTNKKDIIKDYHKRYLVVWLASVVVIQVFFLLCLLPGYVYLISQKNSLQAEDASTKVSGASNSVTQADQVFKITNTELSLLSASSTESTPFSLVAQIVALKGSDITIGQITYENKSNTQPSIVLQGVAANRESLLKFSKKIEESGIFQGVDLPVGSFAKDKNIEFSMSMHVRM